MRIFQCLPRQLEHDALLRIHILRLKRRQTEEFVIEGADVIQVTALNILLPHLRGHHRVLRILSPTSLRQRTSDGLAGDQEIPKLVDILRARETSGATNNRDVARANGSAAEGLRRSRRQAICVFLLRCEQTVRERFNRGVLVRDCRIEPDVQQALELAGEHDNIARGKAEVVEWNRRINFVSPRRIGDPRLQPGGELAFRHGSRTTSFHFLKILTAFLSGY